MTDFLTPFAHDRGERDARGRFEPFLIPRHLMPQIEEDDYAELFAFLEAQGVAVEPELFHPDEIKIRQVMDHVSLRRMPLEAARKPILVSRDLYVLDGNHRATWHMLNGRLVDSFKINADFFEAVELLCEFPRVSTLEAYSRGGR